MTISHFPNSAPVRNPTVPCSGRVAWKESAISLPLTIYSALNAWWCALRWNAEGAVHTVGLLRLSWTSRGHRTTSHDTAGWEILWCGCQGGCEMMWEGSEEGSWRKTWFSWDRKMRRGRKNEKCSREGERCGQKIMASSSLSRRVVQGL